MQTSSGLFGWDSSEVDGAKDFDAFRLDDPLAGSIPDD